MPMGPFGGAAQVIGLSPRGNRVNQAAGRTPFENTSEPEALAKFLASTSLTLQARTKNSLAAVAPVAVGLAREKDAVGPQQGLQLPAGDCLRIHAKALAGLHHQPFAGSVG